jgi:hypothetical protein
MDIYRVYERFQARLEFSEMIPPVLWNKVENKLIQFSRNSGEFEGASRSDAFVEVGGYIAAICAAFASQIEVFQRVILASGLRCEDQRVGDNWFSFPVADKRGYEFARIYNCCSRNFKRIKTDSSSSNVLVSTEFPSLSTKWTCNLCYAIKYYTLEKLIDLILFEKIGCFAISLRVGNS